MTGTLDWILGQGGFLGRHLRRRLGGSWTPSVGPFPWTEPRLLDEALDRSCFEFGRAAAAADRWTVWWCAGSGGIGTPEPLLDGETRAFDRLLQGLLRELDRGSVSRPGCIILSSSAGGVHGEVVEPFVTESSPARPMSAYGRNKHRQEEILARWLEQSSGVSALVARLSNLYGPGQDLSRSTGLVAHVSRDLLWRRPTRIFVPFDTLRDLLHVEDAVDTLLRCAERLRSLPPRTLVTKLIASSRSVSVGALLKLLDRLALRRPLVVSAPGSATPQQPGRHCFRSEVWSDLSPRGERTLEAGVHGVLQDHLALYQDGRLPPPADT